MTSKGVEGCRGVEVYGCMGVEVYGCMGVEVEGCRGILGMVGEGMLDVSRGTRG